MKPLIIPRVPVVYLMRATDGILWKIGRSRVVKRRLRAIQATMRPATLVHVIRTDDAVLLERQLHHRFRAVRDQGEWFRLTSADVAWLCMQRYLSTHPQAPIVAPEEPALPPEVDRQPRAPTTEEWAAIDEAYARLGWGR